jgi:hypothetical protein
MVSNSIALSTQTAIVITGYFSGAYDCDDGPGITKISSLNNDDVFILKLDTGGDFQWAKKCRWGVLGLEF